MNESTEQLIRELAEKLGTTVEHMWDVLIRQASITAISTALIIAALAVAVGWAYKLVRAKTTCPPKTNIDPYPNAEWEDEVAGLAWVLLGFGALIALVFTLCGLHEIVTCLLNPEYWALKEVLRSVQ